MLFLAEASKAPDEVKAWLECLAFLVFLVIGVLKLLDRLKPKPEPRDTYTPKTETAKLETTLKEDLAKVETDLKKDVKRVDDDVRSLRKEIVDNGDVRRKSIEAKVESVKDEMHNKFTTLHGEVASAKTSIAGINTQLTHILAVVDQINSNAKGDRKERREH